MSLQTQAPVRQPRRAKTPMEMDLDSRLRALERAGDYDVKPAVENGERVVEVYKLSAPGQDPYIIRRDGLVVTCSCPHFQDRLRGTSARCFHQYLAEAILCSTPAPAVPAPPPAPRRISVEQRQQDFPD